MMTFGDVAYQGKIVENYERDRIIEPIWEIEQKYFEQFIANLPAGSRLLDLPVGTGRFVNFYKKNYIDFVGCDISREMLEITKNKYQLPSNILVQASCESMPFVDGQFDYAICCRLTHLIDQNTLKNMMKELSRIVTKQIVIHFFSLVPGSRPEKSFLRRLKSFVARFVKLCKGGKRNLSSPWSHIQNYTHYQDEIERLFAEFHWKVNKIDQLPDEKYKVIVYVLEKI